MCKQKCKYLLGSGGTVWACTMVLNHLSRSPCSVLELNKRCLEVQLQSTGSSFGLSEAWDFLPWAHSVPAVIPKLALFSSQLHCSDSQPLKGTSLLMASAKFWNNWVLFSEEEGKEERTFTAFNPPVLRSCFQHPSKWKCRLLWLWSSKSCAVLWVFCSHRIKAWAHSILQLPTLVSIPSIQGACPYVPASVGEKRAYTWRELLHSSCSHEPADFWLHLCITPPKKLLELLQIAVRVPLVMLPWHLTSAVCSERNYRRVLKKSEEQPRSAKVWVLNMCNVHMNM